MPFGPLVRLVQLVMTMRMISPKARGDDGEIIPAQPQHGKAEQHAGGAGEQPGDRQAGPEAEAVRGGEQGVGIGARPRRRRRIPGPAARRGDDDVQPPAEHDVGQHHDAQIQVVAGGEERQRDGKDQQRGGEIAPGMGGGLGQAAVGRDGLAPGCGRPRQAWPGAARRPAPRCRRPDRAGGRDTARHPRPPSAARPWGRTAPGRRGADRPASRRGPHTFSTSARPSRPVGMKISTMIRIEKAATSLYWTEK